MPKTTGHSRRTLKGVFKKIATTAASNTGLTDEDAVDASHARSFHEFLNLPAFEAFRIAGAEFSTHPDVFPLEK